jgi:mRNA interferase MazF
VSTKSWTPRRGDIIWLDFDPHRGREQAGHRPALVLSADDYNQRIGLMVVCPITSRAKGYPFEVQLPPNLEVSGVALCDHVRSIDWKNRRARFVCRAGEEVVTDVLAKLLTLLS